MEIFDIVDEYGNPTGAFIERSEAHRDGVRHRTAHIWIVRKDKENFEVLLQKRAMNKDSFPGKFDTSSAGHIQAGDEPLESALRELAEELGIEATEADLEFAGTFRILAQNIFHNKLFKDDEIAFVYIYQKAVDINKLTIQTEELDGVEWFDFEEVCEACKSKDSRFCVPLGGLETVRKYLL